MDSGSNLVFYFWEGREPDNQPTNQRQTARVTIDDDADDGEREDGNGVTQLEEMTADRQVLD